MYGGGKGVGECNVTKGETRQEGDSRSRTLVLLQRLPLLSEGRQGLDTAVKSKDRQDNPRIGRWDYLAGVSNMDMDVPRAPRNRPRGLAARQTARGPEYKTL